MLNSTLRSVKLVLRAIPFAVAAQCSLAATHLVPDGSFDLGTTGWTSASAALSWEARSAFSGPAGLRMQGVAASPSCAAGALYTLDTAQLIPGTLYEFGARTRLEQDVNTPAGSTVALRLGLIKNRNNAAPVYLDGYANTSAAYTDRWTRLFGVYKADFLPTDTVQLCISNAGKTVHIDDVFVRPLTTAEVASPPPAVLDREQLVQVHGNSLVVGSTQTPILLKGVNLYGYNNGNDVAGTENAIDTFSFKSYDEASLQEIASLGFNTVRYLMSYVLFEDAALPGIYKEEGWAHLDRAIAMAKKYNLRLILDMHEPPGGIQLPHLIDMNSRPDIKLRLENLWVAIAQRYKTEAAIAAYDLVNEPYMDNWFLYAPTLISKIRAVDPDHAILVEASYHPNDSGNRLRFYPLPYANLIYDVHYYDNYAAIADTTAYSGSAAYFEQDLLDSFASFYNTATGILTVPVHIGEYGVSHQKYQGEQNLGAEQWMSDMTAAMNKHGMHRSMFAYHETRFGLYRGWNTYPGESTTLNTSLLAMLPDLNSAEPLAPPPPSVDLAVSLSRNLATVTAGQVLTYTLGASNIGNTAADATVTLTLPAAATISSVPTGCSTAATVVTCTQAALDPAIAASWSIGVSYTAAGTWVTTASGSSGGSIADGNSTNNSASVSVTASAPSTGAADLALTTFKLSGAATAGSAFGLNFVLINNGPTTADNVIFTLPLPAGVTKATGGATECTATASQIVCNFGTLTKGTSRNRFVYVKAATKGARSFTGKAVSNNPDSNTGNNSKTLNITVN